MMIKCSVLIADVIMKISSDKLASKLFNSPWFKKFYKDINAGIYKADEILLSNAFLINGMKS